MKTISLAKAAVVAALLSFSALAAQAGTFDAKRNDILAVAKHKGNFTTLTKAIEAAGLQETLTAQGPVTVFAPTDEAFAKLPPGELAALLAPENKDRLVRILSHHVVASKALEADDLKRSRGATSVSGEELKFELVRGRVRVDGARVTGDYGAATRRPCCVPSRSMPRRTTSPGAR